MRKRNAHAYTRMTTHLQHSATGIFHGHVAGRVLMSSHRYTVR